tara:strand:- start:603 stop:1631 length:1029 start_codon:yes stop_codon:yes gene_type:complete
MANAVFSPKDFKVLLVKETTTGTTPTIDSGNVCSQLDVDSVGFPSLNMNQVTAVRTHANGGRILHQDDFFQDNTMRSVELSISGTFHKDQGHAMLLYSLTDEAYIAEDGSLTDAVVTSGQTGDTGKYGEAEANKTFSIILASPDTTDGKNIVLSGCLCTNFTLSADMGTDGGLYKYSATISTGRKPTFTGGKSEDTPSITAYSGNHISMSGIDVSETKIYSLTSPILSSFEVAIDHPAVYTGVDETNGYACFGRGEELSITANATVKYDSLTRDLFADFETGAVDTADAFTLNQNTDSNASIQIPSAVLTDVSFNEGDVMMVNVAQKAVAGDSGAVLTIDLT